MSNQEWDRWSRSFKAGGMSMPDVVGRARNDRRQAKLGVVFFYGIVALVALVQIPYVTHPRPAGDYIGLFVVDTGLLALAASVQAALRGTWGDVARTPMEALTAMERRHAGRLRLGR